MSKREEWKKRLEQQRASGLSVLAWCKKHGIPEHQYKYWQRVLAKPAAKAKAGYFVQVGERQPVELQVGDQIRVKIPVDFDGTTLKRLLEVLGC